MRPAHLLSIALGLVPLRLLAVPAGSDDQATRWVHRAASTAGGLRVPFAFRELADGSLLTVGYAGTGVGFWRHASDGVLAGTAFAPFAGSGATVDAFGTALLFRNEGYDEPAALQRFDGLTGRAAWASEWRPNLPGARFVRVLFSGDGEVSVLLVSGRAPYLARLDAGTGRARYLEVLGPAGPVDPFTTAVDVDGDTVVCLDGEVERRAGLDGAALWKAGFPGLDGLRLTSVAHHPSGDVIVAGSRYDPPQGRSRVYGARLSSTTGSIVWGPVETSLGLAMSEEPEAVVDAQGDAVFVVGKGGQIQVAKLRGADGSLAFVSPSVSSVCSLGFTVDARGDLAALFSRNDSIHLARWSGEDGSLLSSTLILTFLYHSCRGRLALHSGGDLLLLLSDSGDSTVLQRRDSTSHGLMWETPGLEQAYDDPGFGRLLLDEAGGLVALSGNQGAASVRRVDPGGRLSWEQRIPGTTRFVVDGAVRSGTVVLSGGTTDYLAYTSTLDVRGFDLATGRATYQIPMGTWPWSANAAWYFVTSGESLLATNRSEVLRLDPTSGTILWRRPTPARSGDWAVVGDGRGGLLIADPVREAPGSSRTLIELYGLDGADGHLLWGPSRPLGETGTIEGLRGWAATPEGDAIVAIERLDLSTYAGRDIVVCRISAGSGTVSWRWTSSQPEYSARLTTDPAGNALLSSSPGSPGLVRLRKLLASDGTLDWIREDVEPDGPPTLLPLHNGDLALFRLRDVRRVDGRTGGFSWGPSRLPFSFAGILDRRALQPTEAEIAVCARSAQGSLLALLPDRKGILSDRAGTATLLRPFREALQASRAHEPLRWTLASGRLPSGLTLDEALGTIEGIPLEAGTFTLNVRLEDAEPEAVEKELELVVEPGWAALSASPAALRPGGPGVGAFDATAVCQGSGLDLATTAPWSSYRWLRTDDRTATTRIFPIAPLTAGVLLEDASGRPFRGSIHVVPVPDRVPPLVAPPPDIAIATTRCLPGGQPFVTSGSSPGLATFLRSAVATDTCSSAREEPPTTGGAVITDDFAFLPGSAVVAFPFSDRAGNLGRASSRVEVTTRGDLTRDGRVDVFDLTSLAAHLVGNVEAGDAPFLAPPEAADTDADGDRDLFDLVVLASRIVGNVHCLPWTSS